MGIAKIVLADVRLCWMPGLDTSLSSTCLALRLERLHLPTSCTTHGFKCTKKRGVN